MSLYSHSHKAETCFWLRHKPHHARLTAISLQTLKEIAMLEGTSMSRIVAQIEKEKFIAQSLTSAIRDWILLWLLEHPMKLSRFGLGPSGVKSTSLTAKHARQAASRRRRPSRAPIASSRAVTRHLTPRPTLHKLSGPTHNA